MAQIECTEVSKRYLRGRWAQHVTHMGLGKRRAAADWFLALDRVNLTISRPGQRIGIIGTNGSGKTTLLRIIAGITTPTSGTVVVHGRVAPLLEPVTGMQPDLTGRENIYLVGVILGMRRQEIKRKFDSIVEFAGIGDFIHMPLKHYSLGMTMRLGFSIALHVEADILLVDEAWGIGDIGFQNRSFERLEFLHQQGVSMILVSHDSQIIRQLADETLWLHQGQVVSYGPTEEVIESYLKASQA